MFPRAVDALIEACEGRRAGDHEVREIGVRRSKGS
jgi:hypothetical protein